MALPVRTLRIVLAGVAVLLLAVVLGFIGYARYRAHAFLAGLPGKLGIDVRQDTNNVTYSQSYKGRTVFTVHAARQIQRKDGKITLRDVGIILYGRESQAAQDGSVKTRAERADRIHGSEFEYDQKNGILRAIGDVYLDLAPPARAGVSPDETAMIHVKTSGLVYLQKERLASTDQEIQFQSGGLSGKALGASYAAEDGIVVLQSNVRVSGLQNDKPMLLTAAHAELDRGKNLTRLEEAHYTATGDSGTQTVAAQHAVVHSDADGKPRQVEAEGRVTLTGEGRGSVVTERMTLDLTPESRPRQARLAGGVRFTRATPARDTAGTAQTAQVAFNAAGQPTQALLAGGVELTQRSPAHEQYLRSATVELALGGGTRQPLFLRAAEATGPDGAILRTVDREAKQRAATEVHAQRLTARFAMTAAGSQLTGLDGNGQTSIERTAATPGGVMLARDTSTGDSLRLDLAADAHGKLRLLRAEQHGNVNTLHEVAAKKPGGSPGSEHGRADTAIYDAAADRLLLDGIDGKASVTDAASELLAAHIVFVRATGVSQADGAVRVTYVQPGNGKTESIHVIAEHAVSSSSTGMTQFTAVAGSRVRMWQSGSQVEAPVLDFDRTQHRVIARGNGNTANDASVRAILAGPSDPSGTSTPVRITSSQMIYADVTRQIDLHGGVRIDDKDGRMTSREATVFLSASAAGAQGGSGLFAGRVDRLVGDGAVELDQPGRKATGDRLTYTAADKTFVLTGTPATPPRLSDEARGTITGAALRFKTGDDSVVVEGADTAHAGGRVRTEMRVKQ